jgi:hypothetical protein
VKAERSPASERVGPHSRAGFESLAADVVESLGGRYSTELGIDVDRNEAEIERWTLAATLFGARISAVIAERTFAILEQAGVHRIANAGRREIGTLIELLDAGGYARYDLRTAERLRAIARTLDTDRHGRVSTVLDLPPDELESALDALPGWGPVTVGLFLRELRGVRPGINPPLDRRAAQAGEHLGLLEPGARGHPAPRVGSGRADRRARSRSRTGAPNARARPPRAQLSRRPELHPAREVGSRVYYVRITGPLASADVEPALIELAEKRMLAPAASAATSCGLSALPASRSGRSSLAHIGGLAVRRSRRGPDSRRVRGQDPDPRGRARQVN